MSTINKAADGMSTVHLDHDDFRGINRTQRQLKARKGDPLALCEVFDGIDGDVRRCLTIALHREFILERGEPLTWVGSGREMEGGPLWLSSREGPLKVVTTYSRPGSKKPEVEEMDLDSCGGNQWFGNEASLPMRARESQEAIRLRPLPTLRNSGIEIPPEDRRKMTVNAIGMFSDLMKEDNLTRTSLGGALQPFRVPSMSHKEVGSLLKGRTGVQKHGIRSGNFYSPDMDEDLDTDQAFALVIDGFGAYYLRSAIEDHLGGTKIRGLTVQPKELKDRGVLPLAQVNRSTFAFQSAALDRNRRASAVFHATGPGDTSVTAIPISPDDSIMPRLVLASMAQHAGGWHKFLKTEQRRLGLKSSDSWFDQALRKVKDGLGKLA